MDEEKKYPHGKVTALMALVLDMSHDNGADTEAIGALVDEICLDDAEHVRLLSAAGSSQDPELVILLCEVFERRASRIRDRLERSKDRDEVVGLWSQRLGATGIAASIGFVATGVVTGGLGALTVGAAIIAGGTATKARLNMKDRIRRLRRDLEVTERLIKMVREAGGLS